ncbi:MAG: hypothetical protein SLRJCFUN_002131, partial [Candidatus Fervidibacter sp.]
RRCAETYLKLREQMGYPLLKAASVKVSPEGEAVAL